MFNNLYFTNFYSRMSVILNLFILNLARVCIKTCIYEKFGFLLENFTNFWVCTNKVGVCISFNGDCMNASLMKNWSLIMLTKVRANERIELAGGPYKTRMSSEETSPCLVVWNKEGRWGNWEQQRELRI